jgi:hypothetical protein
MNTKHDLGCQHIPSSTAATFPLIVGVIHRCRHIPSALLTARCFTTDCANIDTEVAMNDSVEESSRGGAGAEGRGGGHSRAEEAHVQLLYLSPHHRYWS